ncbi:DnaJ domain-containing protein [Chytriomyces cf. hyalinus JEL632]|nr:DnaJ domain-containing protein [Chytriomyces cf. hyalinus JEL632]
MNHHGMASMRMFHRQYSSVAKKQSLYEVLGVSVDASKAAIKTQFYALSMVHHPDRSTDKSEAATARFIRINEAYSLLSDDSKRREYDRELNFKSESAQTRTGFKQTMRRHAAQPQRNSLHPDDWILYRGTGRKQAHSFYDYSAHQKGHYEQADWSNTTASPRPMSNKTRAKYHDMMREEGKKTPKVVLGWLVFGTSLFFLLERGYIQMIFM